MKKRDMIITGASRGLGKVLYDHYKNIGYDLVGVSRGGPDFFCDLSLGPSFIRGFYTDVLEGTYEDVVVILNAASMSSPEDSDSACPLDNIWRLNLHSQMVFLDMLTRRNFPQVQNVIMISSVAAFGSSSVPHYGALKAGVISLMKSYAVKLAPQGVRVNAISPGFFQTGLTKRRTLKDVVKVPLGREGTPEELIPVVDMLIKCEYITGANIVVDGGKSL